MHRVAKRTGTSLRDVLRQATSEAHDVLDSAFHSDTLADPDAYGDFLAMQLRARLPIERWAATNCPSSLRPPETTPELLEDLLALGRPISLRPARFDIPAAADPLGMAWAIAGSHLGNRAMLAMLRKAGADLPASFLADTRMQVFWADLKPRLEEPTNRDSARGAILAAEAVFACFAASLPAAPARIAA